MLKFAYLLILTVFITITDVNCSTIRDTLSAYYTSDSLKSFKQEWQHYKRPYEDAVILNLKEAYGEKSMNVFMKHEAGTRVSIAGGFYFSDSSVDVLLYDMLLREPPRLVMPEVSFDLASNLLLLEATVSKIFIDTNYYALRNDSAIVYSMEQQGRSPFSLQQVQPYGKLTIIAEDCFMSGFAIATIAGESVNLGHNTFRLADCKFTVEISSNDSSVPPVIAPYFPKRIGQYIEKLLSVPLRGQELMPKLQGSLYSFVNTTAVFEKQLRTYRFNQQRLFKKTSDYLSELCDVINTITLNENKGSMEMKNFEIRFESKSDSKLVWNKFSLKNLRLYGLDTAYAPRGGGSFEAGDGGIVIAEAIRFSSLQVRGEAAYSNGSKSGQNNFAADIADVSVHILIMFGKSGSRPSPTFEVADWRTADFSVVPWETSLTLRMGYQAFVTGYLINEIPACLGNHLSDVLTRAVNELEKKVHNDKEDIDEEDEDDDQDNKNDENNDDKNIDNNDNKNNDNKSIDNNDNKNDGNNDNKSIDKSDNHEIDDYNDDAVKDPNIQPMAGNNEKATEFSAQFELSDKLFSDDNRNKDILGSDEPFSGRDVADEPPADSGRDVAGSRFLVFAPEKISRKWGKKNQGSMKSKSKSRSHMKTRKITNKTAERHGKKALKFKHITFRRDLTNNTNKVMSIGSLAQPPNARNSTPQSSPHMSDNEIN